MTYAWWSKSIVCRQWMFHAKQINVQFSVQCRKRVPGLDIRCHVGRDRQVRSLAIFSKITQLRDSIFLSQNKWETTHISWASCGIRSIGGRVLCDRRVVFEFQFNECAHRQTEKWQGEGFSCCEVPRSNYITFLDKNCQKISIRLNLFVTRVWTF